MSGRHLDNGLANTSFQHLPGEVRVRTIPAVASMQRAGRGNVETAGLSCRRSEEHTSELQSLMRISYAVFCLKKKNRLKIQYVILSMNHRHSRTSYYKIGIMYSFLITYEPLSSVVLI